MTGRSCKPTGQIQSGLTPPSLSLSLCAGVCCFCARAATAGRVVCQMEGAAAAHKAKTLDSKNAGETGKAARVPKLQLVGGATAAEREPTRKSGRFNF